MLHLHRAHRLSKSNELIFSRFFVSVALAMIDTIWALYMDRLGLTDPQIGFLSAGLVILSLVVALNITPLLEWFNQKTLLILSLLASTLAFVAIAHFDTLAVFIAMSIILVVAGIVRNNNFNIIFRNNTKAKNLNQAEGFLFTILNIGWLIGPIIAGFIMVAYGLRPVFIAAALTFLIPILLFFSMKLKKQKERPVLDRDIKENIKAFLKNKKLHLPYLLAAGIETWWALIYIYIPLFIMNAGLGAKTVSIFITVIVIPLILLEYLVGKWSERYSFKRLFVIGYAGLAIVSVLVFIVPTMQVRLILLALASFFVAFLEPLQDTFFFRQVKQADEEKYYPIFKTASDTGSFLGKVAIAAILLLFFDKAAYLVIAALMVLFTLAALRIRKGMHILH